jgi:broad specificity phosphatase PhoE
MKLIFLRHPETLANVEHLIYGKTDYPYTEIGKQQFTLALESVKTFTYNVILTSPIGRALNLAEAVATQSGVPFQVDSRLEEMNHGVLEGLTTHEAEQKYPKVFKSFMDDFETFQLPDGESYEMFSTRIYEAMDEVIRSQQDCLIVTHGGVIRTALEYLLNCEPGLSWYLEVGNCSFIEINMQSGHGVITTILNPSK